MIDVRNMQEEDVEAVALLEERTFAEPWSAKSLNDFLKHGYAHFFVAILDDKVAGYIGAYEAGDSMDITNVAVEEAYRKCGIGSSLVRKVVESARAAGSVMVSLEVRESNVRAIRLYEKEGFEYVGARKNFYSRPVENALIYQYVFK